MILIVGFYLQQQLQMWVKKDIELMNGRFRFLGIEKYKNNRIIEFWQIINLKSLKNNLLINETSLFCYIEKFKKKSKHHKINNLFDDTHQIIKQLLIHPIKKHLVQTITSHQKNPIKFIQKIEITFYLINKNLILQQLIQKFNLETYRSFFQMGDVTSTCCQNTSHMQEMNITREFNTEQVQEVQTFTYEPFHQAPSDIRQTIKEAYQSSFFKQPNPPLSFEANSSVWNQDNTIKIVTNTKTTTNGTNNSIFDMIKPSADGKFTTYLKSLQTDNTINDKNQLINHENQPSLHHDLGQQVFTGLFLIYFPNKQYFLGYLDKNLPTNGIFVFKPGCYYVGNIKDLTAEGEGKYENKQNGYIYEGTWSKNLQHGNGKQIYSQNEETFQGQFMYGSKFGEGKYTFQDGRVYQGYFYNGHSDGQGKLTINSKEWYKGEWKLGSIQGHGQYHYANGDVYYGQFENGLKSGKGRYVFSAGYEYDGQWQGGRMHGPGVIKEGYDQIEGEWIDGKRVF